MNGPSRCHQNKREWSDVMYSLGPWCVRGASLGSSSSDEFSWDSAPWSSLSFFAKLQPPHSLTSLFFFDITWRKQLHAAFNSPLNVVSGFRSSVSLHVEKKWQQRIPIWGDADAQPEGLASCLSHLAPSALGKAAPCDWNHCQGRKHSKVCFRYKLSK